MSAFFLNAYKYSIQTLNSVTLKKKSLYFNVVNGDMEISKGRGLLVVNSKMYYMGTTFTMKMISDDKVLCGDIVNNRNFYVLK